MTTPEMPPPTSADTTDRSPNDLLRGATRAGGSPSLPEGLNPTRLAHDLRNLVRLVKSLDEEKGVESAWTESADVKAVLDAPDPTPHLGREPARAAPPPKKSHTDDKGAPAEGADQGADMETDEPAPRAGGEIEGDGTGGVDQDAPRRGGRRSHRVPLEGARRGLLRSTGTLRGGLRLVTPRGSRRR